MWRKIHVSLIEHFAVHNIVNLIDLAEKVD